MEEEQFYSMVKEQLEKLPTFKRSSLYMYDQVMGFYYAVSWSKERWLQALLALHVVLLLLVLFARRFRDLQILLFLAVSGAIVNAEALNKLAEERWREFSTQNYFDKHGVFMSVVFSGPLLIILMLQLILTLIDASKLVVKVKRLELGIDKRQPPKNKDE